jgi:hypothetical protein
LEYNELLFQVIYATKYNVVNWNLVNGEGSPFCRFVNLLRTSPPLVNKIRSLVIQNDPELMKEIRFCQNLTK